MAKRTNNDLQNIHIKLKNRVTRLPLKTGGELRCSGRVSSSCSTSGTRRVNLMRQWAALETEEVDTSLEWDQALKSL